MLAGTSYAASACGADMALYLTPRSIVRYGCMLLTVVVVYNIGRHFHMGDHTR